MVVVTEVEDLACWVDVHLAHMLLRLSLHLALHLHNLKAIGHLEHSFLAVVVAVAG